jgi:hypothetical protein
MKAWAPILALSLALMAPPVFAIDAGDDGGGSGGAASEGSTISGADANGVVYSNGSSALTTDNTKLKFDGTDLTASGGLRVGSTGAPSYPLHVATANNGNIAAIESTTGGASLVLDAPADGSSIMSLIFNADNTGVDEAEIAYDQSNNRFYFRHKDQAGSSEVDVMYITSAAVTVSGTVNATTFSGSGASLTSVPPSALAASNSPAAGDLLTYGSAGQVTYAAPANDGWQLSTNTWTGLGPSSFTINADMTGKIGPGDKLKITQSGTKYFYATAAAYTAAVTTVTVAVNADYTMSAGAFTAGSYSHSVSPVGFPDWFNFTTTYTGFSADPTPSTVRYKIVGRQVLVRLYPTALGTSNATGFTFTVPVTSANQTDGASGYSPWTGFGKCADNSAVKTAPCSWEVPPNGTTVELYDDAAQSAWTGSGSKGFFATVAYEF